MMLPVGIEPRTYTFGAAGAAVADLEGVRGVRSNPPLGPNYFKFMGKLKKIQVKCSKRTPLRGFEPPFQKSWIRPCADVILVFDHSII